MYRGGAVDTRSRSLTPCHAGVYIGWRSAANADRHMMLAKPRAARRNLVLGVRELTAQAHRLVFGRAHPAERQVHAAECGLALDETEGLRNGELEGEPKERSEESRGGKGCVSKGRTRGSPLH